MRHNDGDVEMHDGIDYKERFKPKPLRNANKWKAFQIMKECSMAPPVLQMWEHAAKVTCRDCFGFGHSATKCPTGKKFDDFRKINELVRSLIYRYRSKISLQIVLV